ncbi:MAG: hypothetical protein PVG60_08765 [Desulfarculaceae bacterium]|jgi:hypothetical protein
MKPGQILAAALAAALLGMIMPAFAWAQGNPAGLGKPGAIALPAPATPQKGRYRLVAGEYDCAGKPGGRCAAVFRIDTVTGQSWIYMEQIHDGKRIQGWFKAVELK